MITGVFKKHATLRPLAIKEKWMVALFVAIFVVKGIFYASVMTPLSIRSSPDDVGHFSYIQYIYAEKKVPLYMGGLEKHSSISSRATVNDGNFTNAYEIFVDVEEFSSSGNWITQHPPLYYLLMSIAYAIVKVFTHQLAYLLLGVRLTTVALGALMIIVVYRTTCLLDANRNVKFLVLAFLVFSPGMQYYFSTVTNDSLVTLLCAAALFRLLKYTREKRMLDFYLFVIWSAGVINTKILGAFPVICYVLYFIYCSYQSDGLRKTINLAMRGAVIGLVLVAPYLLYVRVNTGSFFPYMEDASQMQSLYDYTLWQYIFDSSHIQETVRNLMAIIGHAKQISIPFEGQFLFCIVFSLLAVMAYVKSPKTAKNGLAALMFILFLFLSINATLTIYSKIVIITVLYIALLAVINANPGRERSETIFFVSTIAFTAFCIIFQLYNVYLERGVPGATHGRYYYILWFPFIYLMCKHVGEVQNKWVQRFLPGVIAVLLIGTEVTVMTKCLEVW